MQIPVTVNCVENLFCEFSFTQNLHTGTDPSYPFYVKIGTSNGDLEDGNIFDGNDGFYRFSLEDPNQMDDPDQMYWVNGTAIRAGGSITVRGINTSDNSLMGLGATAFGGISSITLSNLQVYNNGTEGVYLRCGELPDGSISGYGTGTISISGSNDINDNGWEGLIMATSGNVTLSNLEASRNGQSTWSRGITIREDTRCESGHAQRHKCRRERRNRLVHQCVR